MILQKNILSSKNVLIIISLITIYSLFKLNEIGSTIILYPTSTLNSKYSVKFTSCGACKRGISIAKKMNQNSFTRKILYNLMKRICGQRGYDKEFCNGVINLFAPWVLEVLNEVDLNNEKVDMKNLICYSLNKSCPYKQLPVPKLKFPKIISKYSSPILSSNLTILHISDIHIDPEYLEGYISNCNRPICCRPDSNSITEPKKANKWGEYTCDTSKLLAEHMFKDIKKKYPKLDLIIFTGDLPPHDVWDQDRIRFNKTTNHIISLFKKEFFDVSFFPTVGNHESVPVDYFPINSTISNSTFWSYEILANHWSHWLSNEAKKTLKKMGVYSQLYIKGLRIISINSNMCNILNFWIPTLFIKKNQQLNYDPNGVLQWLIDQLYLSFSNNEKVFIIGHVPPGDPDCYPFWSEAYNKIIHYFSPIISGQFFGHTHLDQFQIFYRDQNKTQPDNIAFVGPSVTPFIRLNPSYRVYNFDKDIELINHHTYIANLSLSNAWGHEDPIFEKAYSAKDYFSNIKKNEAIKYSDWHNLSNRLLSNRTLFQFYYKNMFRSKDNLKCDRKCINNVVCSIKASRSINSCILDPPIDRH